MKSLKKERLSQQVIDAIKEIIRVEALKPGDRLYSEHQLSRKLEVSRSSIREAVRILEVTGLVRVHQGKGIYIAEPDEEQASMKRWVVDNTELLKEHFEVRLLIEPHAAFITAEKASEEEIAGLEKVYASFVLHLKQGDITRSITEDSKFHLKVAECTGNRTLMILMKTMANTLNEGWIASLNTPGRLERTVVEHRAILDMISEHCAEGAADKMREHLFNALNDIRSYTGGSPDRPRVNRDMKGADQ